MTAASSVAPRRRASGRDFVSADDPSGSFDPRHLVAALDLRLGEPQSMLPRPMRLRPSFPARPPPSSRRSAARASRQASAAFLAERSARPWRPGDHIASIRAAAASGSGGRSPRRAGEGDTTDAFAVSLAADLDRDHALPAVTPIVGGRSSKWSFIRPNGTKIEEADAADEWQWGLGQVETGAPVIYMG